MFFCDIFEIVVAFLKLSSHSPSKYFTLCCVNKLFLQEFHYTYKMSCLNDWFENRISAFYLSNSIHYYKSFEKISEICFRFNLMSKCNLKPIVCILKIQNGKLSLTVSSGYKIKRNENTENFCGNYYRSNRYKNIKSLKELKILLETEYFDESLFIPKVQHTYTTNVIKTNVRCATPKMLRFGE
jgi:hypothetical protein